MKFNANDLGGQDELDGQGRLTLPPKLRAALDIENQYVQLYADGDRLEFLSEKVYAERQIACRQCGPGPVR